jgi:hypothetical protein
MKLGCFNLNHYEKLEMKYWLPKLATGLLLLERSLSAKVLYAIFFSSEGVAI